ncbi:hypothetical protein [Oharaeibacter diazotrophicus]|uniref:Uncharacterized protein n=1 Tax=Oharaeibacter diazotrophicus TaxID=1920512 RepID=A0A4R6RCS4_9HYPH|nr:hypothetical protein [Oharaeibacter diazotrophicus]TDP83919.1 hypothetical protein EDD54_2518 [Oharaeibacter diazotrophicus]BBE72960.1 hypothetical protein OHA_1_02565 [Pleomorphomonas sp. SM30]GLS74740.1 hypothetical protein GCM10007904_00750 [Oharaeibacter diazotrophicus]
MGRRIIDIQLNSPGGAQLDTYVDKVVKYVPADVIAAWTAVLGLVKAGAGENREPILWACFAFGTVFTAIWTWRQAASPSGIAPRIQTIVSTAAFAVWAIAIGPPFDAYLDPIVGSLLLIGFTLVSGLVPTGQGE